ncbi:MAG: DUF4836 family protein, partial [Bacteroidales bacterium]|nr:DUF4836 family protein [Bacteroidales bacterium]
SKDSKNIETLLDEELMRELEKESYHTAQLLRKLLKDPNATGINITKKIYAFAQMVGEEFTLGIVCSVIPEILEKNIDNIAKDLKLMDDLNVSELNGMKFYEIEEGNDVIFGWKGNDFILLANTEHTATRNLLEKYFSRTEYESIVNNQTFKEFEKSSKFFNAMLSSNCIKEIDDRQFQQTINDLEDYSGIVINDNWGFFYYDVQKDRISVSATLKFNETIQNMDYRKIQRNYNKILRLMDSYTRNGRCQNNDDYYSY